MRRSRSGRAKVSRRFMWPPLTYSRAPPSEGGPPRAPFSAGLGCYSQHTMVTLTESAASKIKEFLAEEPDDVSVLRVAIEGGGCSGFQYALGFDRGPKEGDDEIEMDGVRVVIDPVSAPY